MTVKQIKPQRHRAYVELFLLDHANSFKNLVGSDHVVESSRCER